MATWRAKCWLGSDSGYQELEVQSNTSYGAKRQLEEIYGAEQIINLRQVNSGSGGSSSEGSWALILLLGSFAILYYFWPFFVGIAILWIVYKFIKILVSEDE